ncbi:hypothetical protein SUGI_0130230 [Cryptomeria japonica]|nr:hypothetical protein SUGI_0130230 [Cryptomeria japonica]
MTDEEKKNEGVAHLLVEILLAVKEDLQLGNSSTLMRETAPPSIGKQLHSHDIWTRAYELLVKIGHCLEDSENGGSKEKLRQFFNMVLGCLADTTYDECSMPNLLLSVHMLLQSNNMEVIKATSGLMKVVIATYWNDSKIPFKAKIRLLFEMLVREYGLEAVKCVMPEQHMKLLTNIRKERKEKKKSCSSQM